MFSNELFDWYILEINPDPWAIGPVGFARRGGKMSAYVGRNQQLDAYKQAVKEELSTMPTKKLDGKIGLICFFWRTIDEYTTAQARKARSHEADTTNLQKATEDALQGILFDNDRDVIWTHSRIIEQSTEAPGRVVVGVSNQVQKFLYEGYPFDKLTAQSTRHARRSSELDGQEEFDYSGTEVEF